MLSALATLVSLLVVLAAIVLLVATTRPKSFVVERSATIAAPAAAIYPLIADFHNWPRWSPYEALDPSMKRTLSGAPSGKGAVYAWEGNGKAGVGRMEIEGVTEPSRVTIKLDFSRPIVAHNTAEFLLKPAGGDTAVTWSMKGASPFMFRVMGLFFDMDKMIGKDFAAGLAKLKAVAERPA